MAEGVIDGLETVQIDKEQGETVGIPCRLGDGHLNTVDEQTAVGQAGQQVMEGQVLDLRLLLLAFRDVGEAGNMVLRVAPFVADQADGEPDWIDFSALASVTGLSLP